MFTNMFAVAVLAASAVSGIVIPHHSGIASRANKVPRSYNSNVLEPYATYNTRYTALDCKDQHGKPFFDECCHPLLKNQKLSSRPSQCDPANNDNDDDEDCEDEDEPTSTAAQPTTTAKAVNPIATAKTTAPAAAPTSKSPAKGPTSLIKGGFGTFFYQGGVAGACGNVHSDNDLVVAMDARRYGDTGKVSDLCGKHVQITNTDNGKTVTALVADACPTCTNSNSIDLSKAAFDAIAAESTGEVPIAWAFV